MKTKLFYGLALLVIAVVAAVNMTVSSNGHGHGLSDLSLANVEALARNEIDPKWGMFDPYADLCCNTGATACLRALFGDKCD